MIVKVCGVNEPAVAEAAVDAGADLVGLVFEPRSPRHVDDVQAKRVAGAVATAAQLVGVFVEPTPAQCMEAVERYGLAAVQVHGDVESSFVAACDVPVIRGYNVRGEQDALTLQWWPDCLLLLDAPAPDGALPGGTGIPLPRELAAEVARHRRIILAGGIGAGDVRDAILAVRPQGVDASSKLETSPGRKDPGLVHEYVRNARAAFAELSGG